MIKKDIVNSLNPDSPDMPHDDDSAD